MNLVLQIIYQLLTAFLIFIIAWNAIKSENKTEIISSAMILIIFIIRVLLIK